MVETSCKRRAVSALLHAEADIVRALTAKYDAGWEEFDQALEVLFSASARVILSGMGKSGHVATKIAATMSSLG